MRTFVQSSNAKCPIAYGTPVKADPPAKVKDWNETILAAETPELI